MVSRHHVSIKTLCLDQSGNSRYEHDVPRIWNDTIEEHRRAVHDAVLDAAEALVHESGLTGVTMSALAQRAGIGRATLYKYFADVDAVIVAWHKRHISAHMEQLEVAHQRAVDEGDDPIAVLEAVLHAYALVVHEHHGKELAGLLHQRPHAAHAERHLHMFVRDLVARAARKKRVRDDVAPEELAAFALHALAAAAALPSKNAVRRLVQVTLAGLKR